MSSVGRMDGIYRIIRARNWRPVKSDRLVQRFPVSGEEISALHPSLIEVGLGNPTPVFRAHGLSPIWKSESRLRMTSLPFCQLAREVTIMTDRFASFNQP